IKEADTTSNTVIDQQGGGFDLDKDHMANFLDSIDGQTTPNSDYKDAYKSVLLCHLGNISYRTGRALDCDTTNGHIKNDEEANKLWTREYEKGWELTL
ncbi:MAG: gfo/Idh/MocA family oxidoreductase, partial [Cyclobacteriaceae bacterium]|nr:gfo/Idh/MocA family oxidoreductase [Cyclobacteriaceae bacterium]